MHRNVVSACVKYEMNDKLYPIRVGNDKENRNKEPETSEDNLIYRCLKSSGQNKKYLYIKNIEKLDKSETNLLKSGENPEQTIGKFRDRAKNKYTAFIDLPIRAGIATGSSFTIERDLGFIGFDLMEKYGFGNVEEPELHYLACFADIMSELILNLKNSNIKKPIASEAA